MNIGVCAKVAPDTSTPIRVKADGSGIETAGVKFLISAYDTFAVELAIQLKEQGKAGKALVFSIGDDEAVNQLRTSAIAPGCDELTVCQEPAAQQTDALGTARILAAMVKAAPEIGLLLLGNRGVDYDNSQVPGMLAELLGWPLVGFVNAFSLDGDTFTATRNVGAGVQEVVTGQLPVVISCDKGLNTPRQGKLQDLMKAKTKPLHKKTLADLGLSAADVAPAVITQSFSPPPARPKGRVLTGDVASQVKELVRLLREEAKVI